MTASASTALCTRLSDCRGSLFSLTPRSLDRIRLSSATGKIIERFSCRGASRFGLTVEEWRKAEPFLENFVAEEDRAIYSWNYHNRVAALAFPATFRFRARHSDGTIFAAETDVIPISYKGYAVAYHFVRRIGS